MSIVERVSQRGYQAAAVSERLLERARHLPPADAALVELYLRGGASQREMARLVGCPPGSLSRRLRRLLNRLNDPVVGALIEDGRGLEPEARQIGIGRFLLGRSVCELAQAHSLSRGQVRQTLSFLRGWQKGRRERTGA